MTRSEFTAKTKRQAFERSGGVCECYKIWELWQGCGVKLTEGRIRYEHIIPCEIGGDNSLDNCVVLTITCWRAKTDTYDLPVIAKAKRRQDRARGIKPKRGRSLSHPKLKRKVDGTVVARTR